MSIPKISAYIESWGKRLSRIDRIGLMLFVANIILVFPIFFPNLSDIGPWDEAAYINGGRMLLDQGQWTAYGGNPFVNIFYALTYLPYRASPFWLVQSCTLGRVILFVLLWISTYLVAKQLKEFTHPGIVIGLFLLVPFIIDFLIFPSDPLYAAMAGFSLWKLLSYYNTQKIKHLWVASVFLALAALTRNDGLILFPIFIALSLILGWRFKQILIVIAASIIPVTLIVGGYVLFYGLRTGDFELGTMGRTYDNFEAGQGIVGSGDYGINPSVGSALEARRYFGTPEENHRSVFRAIQRNPGMYFTRLKLVIKQLPDTAFHAYGIDFAALLFLLCLRAVIELIRKKQGILLLILLTWPLPLVSGFVITIIRSGHLLLPFYIVLALASIGLMAIITNIHKRERFFWLVILIGMTIVGVFTNKLAVSYSSMLFLLGLWLVYESTRINRLADKFGQALLILLCAGLVVRGPFPSPKIRVLGQEPQEQAVVAMTRVLPENSLVAAGSPSSVYMAKMQLANLTSTDIPLDRDMQQFLEWMQSQNIRAILVNPSLTSDDPRIWALIKPQIGVGLERVFTTDDGDIQILLVKYP